MSDEWTPQQAYCAFATIAIEIDGSVGREEHDALMDYLRSSQVLAQHSDELDGLIKHVHTSVSTHGEWETLARAGKALPDYLKEPAFKAALELTWSDDDSDDKELEFLHEAAKSVGLTDDARDAIIASAVRQ